MTEEFKQISTTNGFMKHNGGILFRTISENEYEFKTKINETVSYTHLTLPTICSV